MHRREIDCTPELWSGELAVDIKSLRLSRWSSSDVTESFDLSLPKGKIYALLGPSGSGKTTLLRCILGLESARAGSVRVFGQVPGSPEATVPGSGVGYVPQDIQTDILYFRSGAEILHIYGKIHGIPNSRLEERVDELDKFFPLCNYQRRLAFGIAIFHSPPLLVLEYPTLDLSSSNRERIWEYLRSLSREHGTTIVFTSDNPDEASRADIIGYMEGFRLRLQGQPDELVREAGCETLKELLVKLQDPKISDALIKTLSSIEPIERVCNGSGCCPAHVERGGTMETMTPSTKGKIETTPATGITFMGILKRLQPFRAPLRRIRALSTTDFNYHPFWMIYQVWVVYFTIMLTRNHTDRYEEPRRWFPAAVVNSDEHPHLSRSFLESLPNTTIVQRTYLEVAQAIASTERDENSGVIIIGKNFSTVVEHYLLDENKQNETTVKARINIDIDSLDEQTAYVLCISISRSFEKFINKFLSENGRNVSSAKLPLQIRHARFGDMEIRPHHIGNSIYMGIYISAAFFGVVVSSAMVMTLELHGTNMELLGLANVTSLELMLSHLILQISFPLLFDLFFFTPFIIASFIHFGWPTYGSLIACLMLRSLHALRGITLGLVIAFGIKLCASRSAKSLLPFVLGMSFALFLFSGALALPIQSVPATILRSLVHGSSPDGFAESLLYVWNHGWSIDVYRILHSFIYPMGWCGFFLVCALILSKFSEHHQQSLHPEEQHDIKGARCASSVATALLKRIQRRLKKEDNLPL